MRLRHLSGGVRLVAAGLLLGLVSVAAAGGRDAIKSQDLRGWLTYIASTSWKVEPCSRPESAWRRHTSRIIFAHGA
jgi:hypothetical protein